MPNIFIYFVILQVNENLGRYSIMSRLREGALLCSHFFGLCCFVVRAYRGVLEAHGAYALQTPELWYTQPASNNFGDFQIHAFGVSPYLVKFISILRSHRVTQTMMSYRTHYKMIQPLIFGAQHCISHLSTHIYLLSILPAAALPIFELKQPSKNANRYLKPRQGRHWSRQICHIHTW